MPKLFKTSEIKSERTDYINNNNHSVNLNHEFLTKYHDIDTSD